MDANANKVSRVGNTGPIIEVLDRKNAAISRDLATTALLLRGIPRIFCDYVHCMLDGFLQIAAIHHILIKAN